MTWIIICTTFFYLFYNQHKSVLNMGLSNMEKDPIFVDVLIIFILCFYILIINLHLYMIDPSQFLIYLGLRSNQYNIYICLSQRHLHFLMENACYIMLHNITRYKISHILDCKNLATLNEITCIWINIWFGQMVV